MTEMTAVLLTIQLLAAVMTSSVTGNRQYILTHERACSSNDVKLVCKSPQTYQPTSATILRKPSQESSTPVVVATDIAEYNFLITLDIEGIYFCMDPDDPLTTSNTVTLLRYPERNPDTRDYYAHHVGTERIDIDCGIPAGVLSMYYDDMYWNRGDNVLRASDNDPRVTVQSQNFSLAITDSRLSDGQTYTCFVEVDNNSAEQLVTFLSYTSPRISPTENITVAVPHGGKENTTLTCSMEAQTGSDTLDSVTASWMHNGEPTDSERHTVLTSIVLNRTEGFMRVESTLTISELELSDSGPVSCHVSVASITAQDGNLRTLHLSSTALLFVISDELTVQVEPVLGGTELCVTQLPIPLPGLSQGRLVIKLTAVGLEPNGDIFTELTTPYDSLTMFTERSVCYTLTEEDTHGLLPSRYVRVQVALRYGGVTGPYIPQLHNATQIELSVPPSPTPGTGGLPIEVILLIGVAVALILLLAIVTIVTCYLCLRTQPTESNC